MEIQQGGRIMFTFLSSTAQYAKYFPIHIKQQPEIILSGPEIDQQYLNRHQICQKGVIQCYRAYWYVTFLTLS
jgi:hypothetical protein